MPLETVLAQGEGGGEGRRSFLLLLPVLNMYHHVCICYSTGQRSTEQTCAGKTFTGEGEGCQEASTVQDICLYLHRCERQTTHPFSSPIVHLPPLSYSPQLTHPSLFVFLLPWTHPQALTPTLSLTPCPSTQRYLPLLPYTHTHTHTHTHSHNHNHNHSHTHTHSSGPYHKAETADSCCFS